MSARLSYALLLILAACAAPFVEAPQEYDLESVRPPLSGLPAGTPSDTANALVMRRDSLDQSVLRTDTDRREAHLALLEFARNPSGEHLSLVGNNASGARGAMADRFRQEVKAEMTAARLAEHEKHLTRRLKALVDERDRVCGELNVRLLPSDARRCAG